MEQEILEKIDGSIKNLKEKQAKIYLFVQDTKGNPKSSVRYMYQMGMALKNAGYNPIILHEKPDYMGVGSWLGLEYMELPHTPVEGQRLEISPEDFIIVPEIFGFVMDQVKDLPCGKIVLCQAYDHMFETLQPGFGWANFGFYKCITISEEQKQYISNVMKNVSIDVLPVYLSDTFEKNAIQSKPIVAVHTREQRKALNFIKTFYLKYPQYRWVTFRDMRGLPETEFANSLRDCMLSVWIDETSSYGTFPLESMKCGVPVMGRIPLFQPNWMTENNGFWLLDEQNFADYTADYIQKWLEDNIEPTIYEEMEKTVSELFTKEQFEKETVELFDGYFQNRINTFEEQKQK
jgi:hypothetical protein